MRFSDLLLQCALRALLRGDVLLQLHSLSLLILVVMLAEETHLLCLSQLIRQLLLFQRNALTIRECEILNLHFRLRLSDLEAILRKQPQNTPYVI